MIEFKDAFNQPLEVGDKVVYIYAGSGKAYAVQGEVHSFTKEMVRFDYGRVKSIRVEDPSVYHGYRFEPTDEIMTMIVNPANLIRVMDKNGHNVFEYMDKGIRGRG